MMEMEQIKVYVGDRGHVVLSQERFGQEEDAFVCFSPLQAKIVAKAILAAAKEADNFPTEHDK